MQHTDSFTCTNTLKHTPSLKHTHIRTLSPIETNTDSHTHTHAHMHTHTNTHKHTHTHPHSKIPTYTHTHTHTHTITHAVITPHLYLWKTEMTALYECVGGTRSGSVAVAVSVVARV